MSFPVRINGMDCDWISVGALYPWSCIAFRIGAGRFSFENGIFLGLIYSSDIRNPKISECVQEHRFLILYF